MVNLAYDVFTPDNVIKRLEPIIFIHGFIETRKTWLFIAPVIARNTRRTAYTIDCRNHGDSPWDAEHSTSVLASDLEEFLKLQRISKVVLVGHCMGAVVAMAFALKRPEMVQKLVVEDSPVQKSVHDLENLEPTALEYMASALENIFQCSTEEEAFKYLYDTIRFYIPLLKANASDVDSYDRRLLPCKWNGKKMEMKLNGPVITYSIVSRQFELEMAGAFKGETLFIWGAESQFKAENDSLVLQHFPRSRSLKFENVGHLIHHHPEQQADFIREVSQFINSAETSKL